TWHCRVPYVLVAYRKLPMRRSREPDKSTLPPPRHRAHTSRLAWGLTSTLRTSTITKNARPKEIFRTFLAFLQNRALSALCDKKPTASLVKRIPHGME